MESINISLCITTMDRFDNFLDKYLDVYLEYLHSGIIQELIICDENGQDYEKILNKYNHGNLDGPIKLYKNDHILGVFFNKLKVSSYATDGHFIALIDSDNFVGDDYFYQIRRFIKKNNISIHDAVVLAPTASYPNYEYIKYNNYCFDKYNVSSYIDDITFQVFMNTANYVYTKCINDKLTILPEELKEMDIYDTVYKHLLCFQQIPNYKIYAVENLQYHHAVHDDSYYMKHHKDIDNLDEIYKTNILDKFYLL